MYSTTTYQNTTVIPNARALCLLSSCRCAVILIIASFGLILMGTILTTVAYQEKDAFFARQGDPLKFIGPILLTVGCILFVAGVIIMVVFAAKGGCCCDNWSQDGSLNHSQWIQHPVATTPLTPHVTPTRVCHAPPPDMYQAHLPHLGHAPPPPGFAINELSELYPPHANQTMQYQTDLPPPYAKIM